MDTGAPAAKRARKHAPPRSTLGKRKTDEDDVDSGAAANRARTASATWRRARVSKKDDINALQAVPAKLRPCQYMFAFGTQTSGHNWGLGTLRNISPASSHLVEESIERVDTFGDEPGAGLETICVGFMHSLTIDELDRVWSWGINDEGQLGRVTEAVKGSDENDENQLEAEVRPVEMHGFRSVQVAAGGSISAAQRPRRGSLLRRLQMQFPQISCCLNHVLALTTTGIVMAWGNGQDGQLGRKILERRKRNALVPEPLHLRNIIYIASGNNTSFAIDQDHVVYAWGFNGQRQTGVDPEDGGDENIIERPTSIRAPHPDALVGRHITQIVSADSHTLFLLNDGNVFGCGCTPDSQLSLVADHPALASVQNHCVHIRFPDPLIDLHDNPAVPPYNSADASKSPKTKLVNVAANSRHNYAVSEAGHVYSWGLGDHFQLALGPSVPHQEHCSQYRLTRPLSFCRLVSWSTAGGQA
ncbi:regulator of chromosome condensation 1/beta-lactamase-inhibitor protein II [Auriculariales sp. MPI-PUGE-AT-0066]|nr:regulator of chromosome condensation 1/beta-lactamase-inhibitor protein II [Auriculariales sp. MPI-PUGE-AT-0066]